MPSAPPFVSCPSLTTRARRPPNTQPDPCEFPDLRSNISIDHEATRMAVFDRSAESIITLTQRAPAFWDLTAESQINLTDEADRLRCIPADAETDLDVFQAVTVAGGRIDACVVRCVDQVGHGFSVEDWIILDQTSLEWTEAFDPGGTIESDAVAMVVAIEGSDRFCYKPIGPICDLVGPLTPGVTYYVQNDGSGTITETEPAGTSVPRLFAISDTETILLPYRPLDPATSGGTKNEEVFDVDAGIVSSKQVTLGATPIAGTEEVYLNGQNLIRGASRDYTITGAVITILVTPPTRPLKVGDVIKVTYTT